MAENEQDRLLQAFREGRISRRDFMKATLGLGLALGGTSVLAACGAPAAAPTSCTRGSSHRPPRQPQPPTAPAAAAAERPLTPTFYQWIEDLHPAIKGTVNPKFPGPQLPDRPGRKASTSRASSPRPRQGRAPGTSTSA